MTLTDRINRALHALAASSAVALVADALARLHGSAQAGGGAAGVAALVAAAASWAAHSDKADSLAHAVEVDFSHLVTPGVAADVAGLKAEVSKLAPAADVQKLVADTEARVTALIPAPARLAVEDVAPIVERILAAKFTAAPVAPAAPAPAAPAG